jgi:hypothetical protein
MMNPEIKTRWVAALRSGDYAQGSGVLYNPDQNQYCCLGVLCDLAVRDGIARRDDAGLSAVYRDIDRPSDASFEHLPQAVARWAGLPNTDPDVTHAKDYGYGGGLRDTPNSLSSWNDSGTPFAVIADLIEDQL